jgi:hypothetical protein
VTRQGRTTDDRRGGVFDAEVLREAVLGRPVDHGLQRGRGVGPTHRFALGLVGVQ